MRVAGPVGVVGLDDVRVVQPGEGGDLAAEPLGEPGAVGQPAVEDLDRHDPAELLLRRAVDRPHRARADEAQNLEPRVVAGGCNLGEYAKQADAAGR